MTEERSANETGKAGLIAPVERLVLVDEVERTETGPFQSQSLPGHLLHIVVAGRVRQSTEGRVQSFGTGTVVWYWENESIRGEILQAPWRFITINFHAPALSPPPDDHRVLRAAARTPRLSRELLALWRNRKITPLERQLRCHRILLELLQEISGRARLHPVGHLDTKVWWPVEKQLRARLSDSFTLEKIQRLSGYGLRTINRACQAATGMPPMKRLKELRLGYARGLVQHSDLPITEIAFRVGYARSQEFSRDYRRRFDITPRDDRRRFPSYRQLERPPSEA